MSTVVARANVLQQPPQPWYPLVEGGEAKWPSLGAEMRMLSCTQEEQEMRKYWKYVVTWSMPLS